MNRRISYGKPSRAPLVIHPPPVEEDGASFIRVSLQDDGLCHYVANKPASARPLSRSSINQVLKKAIEDVRKGMKGRFGRIGSGLCGGIVRTPTCRATQEERESFGEGAAQDFHGCCAKSTKLGRNS